MVHSLANELIHMDAAAEALYQSKVAERDAIIKKAQEDALKMTQRAVSERGTRREEAVKEHTRALQAAKAKTIADATREATTITNAANERQDAAVKHLIDAITNREEPRA